MGSNREHNRLVANGDARVLVPNPDELSRITRSRILSRAPSELALQRLALNALRAGHENAGFLSAARGYLPLSSPLLRLDPAYAEWDAIAAELPQLYRDLSLRKRIDALPVLPATADCLDVRQVLRACALLAILSHAYWYVDSRVPQQLPAQLRLPWAQLRERLGRPQEVITYIDLIVYNWRVRDSSLANPLTVENLELLFPTIGNQEERVFYMTQLEILGRTAAVPQLVSAAQGAVLRDDEGELEAALIGIIDALQGVVASALPKINPNPYGRTHVDPVLWAKTVAPFAVPIHQGDQGPSGTSSPLFNTLDLFFGRKDYQSFLGREIKQLRAHYPRAWQVFMSSLTEVDVPAYIEAKGSGPLRSALREAFELYAGETGFLGRHRMKVYGYLELAFKVGRSVTIGGFGGVFTDRTWDLVDGELSRSQAERTKDAPESVHTARVLSAEPSAADAPAAIRRVTLDVSRSGVRYRGGDRCLILPENDPEVVERTLRALGARGDEPIGLTDEWKAHAKDRVELAGQSQLPIRDVLRYGAIRPVSPRLAEALHARTQSAFLFDAIVRGCTERWELWELLEKLRQRGHDTTGLWQQPGVGVSEQLSRLVPPQRFRVYSVSSAPQSPLRRGEDNIQLTVGQLRYQAAEPAIACPAGASELSKAAAEFGCPHAGSIRQGTGSTFLARAHATNSEVPFRIQHPDVFRLPEDPGTPIVMFAGGSGVAPFRAFLQERARSAPSGLCLLFLSVRSPADFLYEDEFADLVASGVLGLEVAFTRVGARIARGEHGGLAMQPGSTQRIEDLMLTPCTRARLWELAQPVEQGGKGAVFYVCGRGGFADSVMRTLKQIFRPHLESDAASAKLLYRMVGDHRLLTEIHTDARPLDEDPQLFDVSEIARHNDAANGYWIVVDRVVYDLSEFVELHPGGRRVIQAYAGMDATHGFARAHYGRPDVDAMRETYRIGMVRTPSFDDHVVRIAAPSGTLTIDCGVAYRGFVRALQLVVEMQNALYADQSLQHDIPHEPAATTPPVADRSAYKQLRAIETHRRFLKSYFEVLAQRTLPELWCISQGLFFPEQPAEQLPNLLDALLRSPAAQQVSSLAQHAFDQFEAFREQGALFGMVTRLEAVDGWFLQAMKHAITRALREFERHGPHVRTRAPVRMRRACVAMLGVVRRYFRRATQSMPNREPLCRHALAAPAAVSPDPPPTLQRLHTGEYWVFEEDPAQKLAVLRRTPIAATSLEALSHENERVLRCLRPGHRLYGLVVDTRQARMRNDIGFEDAMAKLRRELTGQFQRTAVLLESNIGELQVSRIERDERRQAIATRSESIAFKFAQGAS
jgi:sulfite reductase alpha subunit-like flavoprotein